VAAGGEFHAEFGGDDAGAAVGGVAGDADAHCLFFEAPSFCLRPLRYIKIKGDCLHLSDRKKHGSKDPPLQRHGSGLLAERPGC
jgi:hypothetical protein